MRPPAAYTFPFSAATPKFERAVGMSAFRSHVPAARDGAGTRTSETRMSIAQTMGAPRNTTPPRGPQHRKSVTFRTRPPAGWRQKKREEGFEKNYAGVAFSAKGDQVISTSADKSVQVWNIADGKSAQKLDKGAAATALTSLLFVRLALGRYLTPAHQLRRYLL